MDFLSKVLTLMTGLISNRAEKKPAQQPTKTEIKMLKQYDVVTSSGKYKDRLMSKELTDDVLRNIDKLCIALNSAFSELGLAFPKVSSGFRTSAANGAAGGAKKSLHMQGLACDFEDVDGKLDAALSANPEVLRKYGLFLEDPAATPSWSHVDMGQRADRPSRIFKP